MTSRIPWTVARFAACSLALTACTGPPGPPGAPGPAGEDGNDGGDGLDGLNGEDGILAGTIAGTVTEAVAGAPVVGAAVSLSPDLASAVTDGLGGFELDLPVGLYELALSAEGYEPVQLTGVAVLAGVVAATDIELVPINSLALDAGPDLHQVGLGVTVELTAVALEASAPQFAWTQLDGPTVELGGADTDTLTFTTASLEATLEDSGRVLPDRHELLSLAPREQGRYRFEVVVTEGPWQVREEVAVTAASPLSSLHNVAVGSSQVVVGPIQDSWNWAIEGPSGSTVTITPSDSRTPSFVPDLAGEYTITEDAGSGPVDLRVYAGLWRGFLGDEDACGLCHMAGWAPPLFDPWSGTAHAVSLQQLLDAEDGPAPNADVLASVTVGYELGADNGGFDDVAAELGWNPPESTGPGGWDDLLLLPDLAQLASVQCESCHGPQNAAPTLPTLAHQYGWGGTRVSYSAGVCARCHDDPPGRTEATDWAASGHAGTSLARSVATVESRGIGAADCGRCHAAQGFKRYLDQLLGGQSGPLLCQPDPEEEGHVCEGEGDEEWLAWLGLTDAIVEPQACAACHDPHSAELPGQLRYAGDLPELPAGFPVIGAGTGALCMVCHNSARGLHGDQQGLPTGYEAPHGSSQADVLMGRNAYFADPSAVSVHSAAGNTCVACHVTVSVAAGSSGHSFLPPEGVCAACHGELVTGEALRGEMLARIDALASNLGQTLVSEILTPAIASGDAWLRAWDPDTGLYSSTDPSESDIPLSQVPSGVLPERVGGQIGFSAELANPVALQWSDGSITTTAVLHFRLGELRDGADGGEALVPTSHPLVRAAWNQLLVSSDGSGGLHNPSFVLGVVAQSAAALDGSQ